MIPSAYGHSSGRSLRLHLSWPLSLQRSWLGSTGGPDGPGFAGSSSRPFRSLRPGSPASSRCIVTPTAGIDLSFHTVVLWARSRLPKVPDYSLDRRDLAPQDRCRDPMTPGLWHRCRALVRLSLPSARGPRPQELPRCASPSPCSRRPCCWPPARPESALNNRPGAKGSAGSSLRDRMKARPQNQLERPRHRLGSLKASSVTSNGLQRWSWRPRSGLRGPGGWPRARGR